MIVYKFADDVPKLHEMEDVCRACRVGKAHKLPFPGNFRRVNALGDVVHSDIVGPLHISFPDGYCYVCNFLDEHSRYAFIGLITRRSALKYVFDGVSRKMSTFGGANLKPNYIGPITKVHSDGAKEYIAFQNEFGTRRGQVFCTSVHPGTKCDCRTQQSHHGGRCSIITNSSRVT